MSFYGLFQEVCMDYWLVFLEKLLDEMDLDSIMRDRETAYTEFEVPVVCAAAYVCGSEAGCP